MSTTGDCQDCSWNCSVTTFQTPTSCVFNYVVTRTGCSKDPGTFRVADSVTVPCNGTTTIPFACGADICAKLVLTAAPCPDDPTPPQSGSGPEQSA